MKCPYKYKCDCKYIDTAGMTKLKECVDCELYDNHTLETGSMPVLEWFLNLFKRK